IDYFVPFITARPVWSAFIAVAFIVHLVVKEKTFYRMQDLFVKIPWILKLLIFVICVQLVINFRLESVQPFIYAQF
ncbi:MAG: MBOAT family protein, partial [Muribaculaceae bacterium]|nr:MBOAT family protein [Muribaculaceae bacterium]